MHLHPRIALALLAALPTACALTTAPVVPTELSARAYIEADYGSVWEHFTQAEAISRWYTAPCMQFGTQPGDELVWADGEREIYRGRLLDLRHGHGLSWEFRFVGFGFEEPLTVVDVEIAERGPVVLVSIRHDVHGAPQTAELISTVGWTKPLSRLKTLLESGTAMPWPVEAQSSSPAPTE